MIGYTRSSYYHNNVNALHIFSSYPNYYKFGNFRQNLIFTNSVERHICNFKNSQLKHGLPITVNDRVILLFREGFIFTKFHENKTLAKISELTVSGSEWV